METSKTIKGLFAGVVLASGLMMSTPLAPTVVEAATYYDHQGKPLDIKSIKFGTFQDLKEYAVELYLDPEYDPGSYLVYTKENYKDQFYDYVSGAADISQDVQGYTLGGRGNGIQVRKITEGIYENFITVGNDFYQQEELELERGMKRAEDYIVKNYSLKTEYEVVYAINHFVASQLEYGKSRDNHPYLIEGMKTFCGGYTDFAARLYHRFGIEYRILRGDTPTGVHAWNAVKLGSEWYYSDATFADTGKSLEKYTVFTQDFRDKEGFTYASKFRASNKPFDKSKSLPYDYKAVKAAQAKK